MPFNFIVSDVTPKNLIGIYVASNKKSGPRDCMALWQDLKKRYPLLEQQASYGVAVHGIDGKHFTYWAAIEQPQKTSLPDDMQHLYLAGGMYVQTTAPSIDALDSADRALYKEWPALQSVYALSGAPCFEYYTPGWNIEKDTVEIFAPLRHL